MTELLSGTDLAKAIRADVTADAEELRSQGVEPKLAIVVATEDSSAQWYVGSIEKAAAKVGISTEVVRLPVSATGDEIGAQVAELAANSSVHGIIIQTPLPEGVSLAALSQLVPVGKDVDGINPLSAGLLASGGDSFAPATAAAVLELLQYHKVPLAGEDVTVIGRSTVVGKPLAQLLLRENATVTVTHSRTKNLKAHAKRSNVLVVAIGRAGFVTDEYVSDQTVVIDVGTNTDADGKLVGDVDAGLVSGVAASLSPVPGGVGPVTTAVLLRNTVAAAKSV